MLWLSQRQEQPVWRRRWRLVDSIASSNDPSNPAAGAAFNFSRSGKFNDDQFTTSYDRQFKDGRDKISGRFFFSNFNSFLPFGARRCSQYPRRESLTFGDLNFPAESTGA